MIVRRLAHISILAALVALSLVPGELGGQAKKKPCEKKPEIASGPDSGSEDGAKLKMFKAVGTVAVLVGEEGKILEAKVLTVHPEAARDALLAVAKTAKFKPRPGCEPSQTTIVFYQPPPGRP